MGDMTENLTQNESVQEVVDVRITSNDGRIESAPVYADGSIGQYEDSGYDTNVPDMETVKRGLRAQYGLPPTSGE